MKHLKLVAIFSTLIICLIAGASEQKSLNDKELSIIPIAAYTADGNLPRLKTAVAEALQSGLTINEIKEIMVHLYAYVGFPRSLNALFTFMNVLNERKAKGIKDTLGKDAVPLKPDFNSNQFGKKVRAQLAGVKDDLPPSEWQKFVPIIDTYLKEHLFGDMFARNVLSYQQRELATISALSIMKGTDGQLFFHLNAAINTGFSAKQMKSFESAIQKILPIQRNKAVNKTLTAVLQKRFKVNE